MFNFFIIEYWKGFDKDIFLVNLEKKMQKILKQSGKLTNVSQNTFSSCFSPLFQTFWIAVLI